MRGSETNLHSEVAIRQVIEQRTRDLDNAINGISERELKGEPRGRMAATLAQRFAINVPVLDENGATPASAEVDVDISNDPTRLFMGGGPRYVKGTEITITVPFSGDADVFSMHASNHTMDYPRATISSATIAFVRQGVSLDPAAVRREFDRWLATIKHHLEQMRVEVASFNERLRHESETKIQARIDKLRRDDDLVGGLGFGPRDKAK
jgi:hypothetical protein